MAKDTPGPPSAVIVAVSITIHCLPPTHAPLLPAVGAEHHVNRLVAQRRGARRAAAVARARRRRCARDWSVIACASAALLLAVRRAWQLACAGI